MSWKRTRTTSAGQVRRTGYYRDPNGATRSAGTFTRVKDALAAADEQETLVAKRTWVDPDVPVVVLAQPTLPWCVDNKWWRNRRLELNTRTTYDLMLRLYLLPRFGDELLINIIRSDVQNWVTDQQRPHAVLRRAVLQTPANDPGCQEWRQRGP